MTDFDLYDALQSLGLKPHKRNGQWLARCPIHDDQRPSLSCRVADGRLLAHCFAGCPFQLIAQALNLSQSEPYHNVREVEHVKPPFPQSAWMALQRADVPGAVEAREQALGIATGGLRALGTVWSGQHEALACPMYRNLLGEPIGVRFRSDDGSKWAVVGSQNGLFRPRGIPREGPLYMPEGLTDTALLAGLGMDCLGRASCNSCREMIREIAKIQRGRLFVAVTDADTPGRAGANQLARELTGDGHKCKVVGPAPGHKDIRAWGPSREAIEYAVKSKSIWCK